MVSRVVIFDLFNHLVEMIKLSPTGSHQVSSDECLNLDKIEIQLEKVKPSPRLMNSNLKKSVSDPELLLKEDE
jgi:hypothetical protein